MFIKRSLLAFVLLLCVFVTGLLTSFAQTKSDEDVVRITTNLVQIDAVVTKNGKMVTDLKAEDFEIFEDGRRQQITSFAYISNVPTKVAGSTTASTSNTVANTAFDPNSPPPVPTEVRRRTIAFVIDDLGLSAQSMTNVRAQLGKFINEQLNPNDLIAIILTSKGKTTLPQFTNDKAVIAEAWKQVVWNQCSRVGLKALRPDEGKGCGNPDVAVSDSLRSIRAILEAMGKTPGRKSMILMTDDIPIRDYENFERPNGSVTQANASFSIANNYSQQLNSVSEVAIRSSVVIYAVEAAGLQVTSLQASEESSMSAGSSGNRQFVKQLHSRSQMIQQRREGAGLMAKETGGFLVHDQNNFQLESILNDQSGYYLIGYRPSSETFDKRFNKIKARVKKPGMTVRTRSGFFGLTEEDAKRLKDTKK